MRSFSRVAAILGLTVGCISLSRQTRTSCFASARVVVDSASGGPDWVWLGDVSKKDSGAAHFGFGSAMAGAGHWWRVAPDSVRIAAHGPFNLLAMRAVIRGDSLAGRFIITTDVFRDSGGKLIPASHNGEWIGKRRSCSGL